MFLRKTLFLVSWNILIFRRHIAFQLISKMKRKPIIVGEAAKENKAEYCTK
jgi:hypothetical protein